MIDLTGCYDAVRTVRRSVMHLTPGIVAVLDEAKLEKAEEISLRWHTADRAEPDVLGQFVVGSQTARLVGRVVSLGGESVRFRRGQHAYRPPYDRGRLGDKFEDRHESYIEALLSGVSCRVLTLFAVQGTAEPEAPWEEVAGRWSIRSKNLSVSVSVSGNLFRAEDLGTGRAWSVALTPLGIPGG